MYIIDRQQLTILAFSFTDENNMNMKNNKHWACSLIFSIMLISSLSAQSNYNNYRQANSEVGEAVYYADYLDGEPTASGEIYDRTEFTAAHNGYAFGTMLKVTNLENNKSVIVRVNDRGGFKSGVSVDLSRAAAAQLDMLRSGRTTVRIEPVGRSADNSMVSRGTSTPSSYSNSSENIDRYLNTGYRSENTNTTNNQGARFSDDFADSGLGNANLGDRSLYGSIYDRTPARSQNATNTSTRNQYPLPSEFSTRGSSRINTTTSGDDRSNTNRVSGFEDRGFGNSTPQSYNSANELPGRLSGYTVQVASYENADNANRQVNSLRKQGFDNVYLKTTRSNSGRQLNKVVMGNFPNRDSAERYLSTLKTTHLIDGFIIKL
jgi:rare lipoprotein A